MIPGLEADDVIAILAWELAGELDVIGQDKDLVQLKPHFHSFVNFEGAHVTGDHLWSKVPVALRDLIPKRAHFVAWYLAVMGDSSDGIPRLIPAHGLRHAANEIERSDCLWEYAVSRWGNDFIRNLRLALLPFPQLVNDLDDDELVDLCKTKRWGPTVLLHRIRADVLIQVREYLEDLQLVLPDPDEEQAGVAEILA
jgi:hypothetical protein